MKRQVDWLVNGSLTGPIFSRALNQLTQLEIFPARDKDWPVNEPLWPDSVNYLIELAMRSVFFPCGLLVCFGKHA